MGLHTFLRQYRHYVYLVIMIFRKITKSQSQNHKKDFQHTKKIPNII